MNDYLVILSQRHHARFVRDRYASRERYTSLYLVIHPIYDVGCYLL